MLGDKGAFDAGQVVPLSAYAENGDYRESHDRTAKTQGHHKVSHLVPTFSLPHSTQPLHPRHPCPSPLHPSTPIATSLSAGAASWSELRPSGDQFEDGLLTQSSPIAKVAAMAHHLIHNQNQNHGQSQSLKLYSDPRSSPLEQVDLRSVAPSGRRSLDEARGGASSRPSGGGGHRRSLDSGRAGGTGKPPLGERGGPAAATRDLWQSGTSREQTPAQAHAHAQVAPLPGGGPPPSGAREGPRGAAGGASLREELAMLEELEESEGQGHRNNGHVARTFPGPQTPRARVVSSTGEWENAEYSHSQKQGLRRQAGEGGNVSRQFQQTGSSSQSRSFEADALTAATNRWSEKNVLGRGRFGTVYSGRLTGCHVAIKRLESPSSSSQREYEAEVEVLSRVRHPHIILLMGHCPETSSLVYEYMPCGSLQDYLGGKDVSVKRPLTWRQRVQVLADVASALVYLHQFSPSIVHRDLKPQNIMLDASMRAKVGDAGLARLLEEEDDGVTCRVSGTFGYIDPELMVTWEVSPKNDVYAFGVICLQLLTGEAQVARLHKLVNESLEAGSQRHAIKRTAELLVKSLDSTAGAWPADVAVRLAEMGLRCASRRAAERLDLEAFVIPALTGMLEGGAEAPGAQGGRGSSGVCGAGDVETQLQCPLSKQRMTDPVLAADGFTYERRCIEQWQELNDWSPVTGQAFAHRGLVPNNSLKMLLAKPQAQAACS